MRGRSAAGDPMLVRRQRAEPGSHFGDLLGVASIGKFVPLGFHEPHAAVMLDQEVDFCAVSVAEIEKLGGSAGIVLVTYQLIQHESLPDRTNRL